MGKLAMKVTRKVVVVILRCPFECLQNFDYGIFGLFVFSMFLFLFSVWYIYFLTLCPSLVLFHFLFYSIFPHFLFHSFFDCWSFGLAPVFSRFIFFYISLFIFILLLLTRSFSSSFVLIRHFKNLISYRITFPLVSITRSFFSLLLRLSLLSPSFVVDLSTLSTTLPFNSELFVTEHFVCPLASSSSSPLASFYLHGLPTFIPPSPPFSLLPSSPLALPSHVSG